MPARTPRWRTGTPHATPPPRSLPEQSLTCSTEVCTVGDMSTRLIDQQAVIDIATMLEERAVEDELTARVREVIPDLAGIACQRDERARALEVERLRAMFAAEPLAVAP